MYNDIVVPYHPQVLDKMSPDTADKIALGWVESTSKKHSLNEKLADAFISDQKSKRRNGMIISVIILLAIIAFIFTCIFTNNQKFLQDLLPIVAGLFGGTGLGGIYVYNKFVSKKDRNIEMFDDDNEEKEK